MRLAMPVFSSRVSPVFDFASRVMIVELKDNSGDIRREVILQGLPPDKRVERLKEEGIAVFICAGISMHLRRMMMDAGIKVVSGVVGDADEVLAAHKRGCLHEEQFLMPGCCKGRWRKRCGRSRFSMSGRGFKQ